MILDTITKHNAFAIYGAQVVAYGAYAAIKHLCGRTPECFVVSSLADNPAEIDGVAVRRLDDCGLPRDTLVVVAVTELWQAEIAVVLRAKAYTNVFMLTAREEHPLMSKYFADIREFPFTAKTAGNHSSNVLSLYEVRHHLDKPLQNAPRLAPWEIPIQVGAALTDVRICAQTDNVGDNISGKNRQYCEASAMYWVRQNASADWIGLEHYRRHLLVTPEMLDKDIDAVLPLPYLCYPNAIAQLRRFVSKDVLRALLHALKTLHPDKYDGYLRILNGQYQYTYNLVCAKREVFNDYCAWLFNITEHMETLGVPEIADTRALSYVAEALTNLYFMSRQDELKIRHAEKAIYT